MLRGAQIAEAGLTEWRKLAQGLHARYVVDDFGTGVRFVAAVGEAGDALNHHPRVTIGQGRVDLELVTADAIYRDDEGTEHVVEWVTQQDVDLARRITAVAADHGLRADPAAWPATSAAAAVRSAEGTGERRPLNGGSIPWDDATLVDPEA